MKALVNISAARAWKREEASPPAALAPGGQRDVVTGGRSQQELSVTLGSRRPQRQARFRARAVGEPDVPGRNERAPHRRPDTSRSRAQPQARRQSH